MHARYQHSTVCGLLVCNIILSGQNHVGLCQRFGELLTVTSMNNSCKHFNARSAVEKLFPFDDKKCRMVVCSTQMNTFCVAERTMSCFGVQQLFICAFASLIKYLLYLMFSNQQNWKNVRCARIYGGTVICTYKLLWPQQLRMSTV